MDEKTFLIVRDQQQKVEAAQARLNEARALIEAWRNEAGKQFRLSCARDRTLLTCEYTAVADTLEHCADELRRALGDEATTGTTEAREWGKITPPRESDFV